MDWKIWLYTITKKKSRTYDTYSLKKAQNGFFSDTYLKNRFLVDFPRSIYSRFFKPISINSSGFLNFEFFQQKKSKNRFE